MDHIYKQAYPCKSIADSCVTQSNMTIVRYLSIFHPLLRVQRYDVPFGHHHRLQGHPRAFQMLPSLLLQA